MRDYPPFPFWMPRARKSECSEICCSQTCFKNTFDSGQNNEKKFTLFILGFMRLVWSLAFNANAPSKQYEAKSFNLQLKGSGHSKPIVLLRSLFVVFTDSDLLDFLHMKIFLPFCGSFVSKSHDYGKLYVLITK